MREYIKGIVELNDNRLSRLFGFSIQILIILSVVTFSIETIPDLKPQTRSILKSFELFCVIIFSIEYLLRIYVSDKKLKFIFSFFGIIDLLAILPFYISFGVDLRSVRTLRFVRLFRLFKLVRYNRAIKHFARAISIAKEEILLFFFYNPNSYLSIWCWYLLF
jgi:voltage-gated potassium channel